MAFKLLVLSLLPVLTTASFFQVDYPNVNISSEPNGDLIFEAGSGGDVVLQPGTGGTVYIHGVDLRKFIQKVKSLPPVWSRQSVHGSLGVFTAGTSFSVSVEAKDPDGGNITYSLVSGHLPPGTTLSPTGRIYGMAPDVDATYDFGIRATDIHGKYADGAFSISIREQNQCDNSPCQNGGTCSDDINGYNCTCTSGYGGHRCELVCVNSAFGVASAKKTIPDAQMAAHYTYSTNSAANGRLGSSNGWIGEGSGSWLQVDLGHVADVYAVASQGYRSSSYYTTAYTVSVSEDGNTFSNVVDSNKQTQSFTGSSSYDLTMKHELDTPVRARFVRFYPTAWHTGGKPGLRVEIYGC